MEVPRTASLYLLYYSHVTRLSVIQLCPLSRALHRRRPLSLCGLYPTRVAAAAAPQHPAAHQTTATITGGLERLHITARPLVPG